MRTPDQVRWDFVQEWLNKAQGDLRAAQVLSRSDLEDYEAVGFHAQQAAEKLMKGLLVRYQIEFPKTHDIRALRALMAGVVPEVAGSLADADELTPYGVEFRYPGALGRVSRGDADTALRLARRVHKVIQDELRAYLAAGRPP